MWGISYLNLLMMLYDQQTTLYDFDSKRDKNQQIINGDSKEEMEQFLKNFKHGGNSHRHNGG